MAAAASLMGLVNQLQGMESQFSMVLMEAAMKIASFTDASIFLLIDTPEGRSWVGRKNLKEEFINGRMQIRPNDVEYDVNPNVSALVRQPTIAEKMAEQQMQMQQQMQMNQMRQTAMRGGGAGRGRGFSGGRSTNSPSGMSPGNESRKRSLPGAGGGTPNKQTRPDDSEVVAVNIKEEDLESDQDLKNVIGRVGVGDPTGSNGDGGEDGGEAQDDSDIEEIVEEKPPMGAGGGTGDDSSSSFLDFSGGGFDPSQPGSSRDLVPAPPSTVATGAAGQKLSALTLETASNFYGISLKLIQEVSTYTLEDVQEKSSPKYKLFNHLQYNFAKSIAGLCPYNEWRGPLVNEFFTQHFQEWFTLFENMCFQRSAKSLMRKLAHSHYNILLKRVVVQRTKIKNVTVSSTDMMFL